VSGKKNPSGALAKRRGNEAERTAREEVAQSPDKQVLDAEFIAATQAVEHDEMTRY
jgi:ferritin-like metal-binding protein YciE